MVLLVDRVVERFGIVVHRFDPIDDLAQFCGQALLPLRYLVQRGHLTLLTFVDALLVLADNL